MPTDSESPEKPLILIVEDDEELRHYLHEEFDEEFDVLEASNGKIGWELANGTECPDLIISDVVMPEMDGLELVRKLKKDEGTSHIPVILLSTKSSEEDQTKGLDTHADDYVTKPFSAAILRRRMRNLIETRKALQRRYRSEVDTSVIELGHAASDKRFLERVTKVIGQNIGDGNFSADQLAESLGMSKSTLYRKIKPITGQSINIFIRTVRLKHAASMMAEPNATIGEIASAVGIWDNSYFSKAFREQFGKTPSEYMKGVQSDPTV